jgi:hypothetical protein
MKRGDRVRVKPLANLPDAERPYEDWIGNVVVDSEPGQAVMVEFEEEEGTRQFHSSVSFVPLCSDSECGGCGHLTLQNGRGWCRCFGSCLDCWWVPGVAFGALTNLSGNNRHPNK